MPPADKPMQQSRALANIRVVDFSWVRAGPNTRNSAVVSPTPERPQSITARPGGSPDGRRWSVSITPEFYVANWGCRAMRF
jgi:hypothetical protein